jgi:aminopeptidase N
MTQRDVLPKSFKPVHYDLEVFNINVVDDTFEGKVKIQLDVKEASEFLSLHAVDIEFKECKLSYTHSKTESSVPIEGVSIDTKNETALLKLGDKVPEGAKALLEISYNAKIKTNMNGFYRSQYTDKDGKDQIMLSTQFEATDARGALPCFDEPNLKATFQLTITVAEDFTALSNTPVVSSKILDDGKKKGSVESSGLKVVKFQQTPIMSTYLLAWAVGKMDYIEAFTEHTYNGKKIPVRIYTQEGISAQGQFGLSVAAKVVDLFSQVFNLDYVLPKLDLISVPSYSHNAMENWGLITFRPTALLFDEKTSAKKYQKKVAYVVAHELAHQWFGNLVTMDWWDELWLNEGFATWVGYYAIDKLFPEWTVFDVSTSEDLQTALVADSSRGSHPVEVPIQSSADIDQVFDHISYLKGSAVINQLAHAIGVEKFLAGVAHYLNKHKFGNAKTEDLWASISEVSNIDVVTMAGNWITKIGFPYVRVETVGDEIKFTQNRFLSAGDVKDTENGTIWWIPLNLSTGTGDSDVIHVTLTDRSMSIPRIDGFFKVNKNSTGFYRVVYDSSSLELIKQNLDKLSATDKVGLINDLTVTATAGLTKTSDALDIIKLLKGESEYVVWDSILNSLDSISQVWYNQPPDVQTALKSYNQEAIAPSALSFEFESNPTEFLVADLRIKLFSSAVGAGVPEVIQQAKELFQKFKAGEDIDPSLRAVLFQAVVSPADATEDDWISVYEIISTSKALDTREIVLGALGTVSNPTLIKKSLELILSPEIPIMDVQFVSIPLSKNNAARDTLWEYVSSNYDAIYERLNANRVVFDRFIKFTLGRYATMEKLKSIREFFFNRDIYGFERSLDQVLDGIETNAKWVERDAEVVADWLKKEKYL